MNYLKFRKTLSTGLAILLMVAQLGFAATYLLTPEPAKAAFGFLDTTVIVGNIPDQLSKIAEGALLRIAENYANKYLTRFVQQIQDKYKINNFLFYDQYLTDYYISNAILKNVSDPDLRQAYDIMLRVKVTGETGGYTGVDPRTALIPQLKKAMADYYIAQGGIDPNKVYNPAPNISDRDYFASAQAYFANPPSFTEQNIQGQFGAFQSAGTTASQLEITVGNGLKAGRVIGGTCNPDPNFSGPTQSGLTTAKDPVACAAAGGTWNASVIDEARSFIQNPTAFVDRNVEAALGQIFKNTYDATNPYTAIGGALGNYIFTQLNLQADTGIINDGGNAYKPDNGNVDPSQTTNAIDIDGDGIPDGYDINGDGQIDICSFGGLASTTGGSTAITAGPPCEGSKDYFTVKPAPTSSAGDCSPAPTTAQTQEAQNMLDVLIPLLNATAPMNPVVTPPPDAYKAEIQAVVDNVNAQFPGSAGAVYAPYSDDNVIAMTFNYIVGPGTKDVSNIVQKHTDNTWINAWRVTCP